MKKAIVFLICILTTPVNAEWIKMAESNRGTVYFVDDALPNVKAVKNVLEQLDIKSKVVQAKVNFSAGTKFNKILEEVTGIDAKKNSQGKLIIFKKIKTAITVK